MNVLEMLNNDCLNYGSCAYTVIDDLDEFSIIRHDPFYREFILETY